jgi:hypothetical protein
MNQVILNPNARDELYALRSGLCPTQTLRSGFHDSWIVWWETRPVRSVAGLQSLQVRQCFKEDLFYLFTFSNVSHSDICTANLPSCFKCIFGNVFLSLLAAILE